MKTLRAVVKLQILAALFLILSCGQRAASVQENAPPAESAVADTIPADINVLTAEDSLLLPKTEPRLFASLRRTSCYGHCPVYEVQFYSNGQALYKGEKNVPLQGIYLGYVPDSTVREIMVRAGRIGYFQLSDFYPTNSQPIADLPETVTYLNDGRQEKTIVNNHLAPVGLINFERFLDGLAREVQWQPKVE